MARSFTSRMRQRFNKITTDGQKLNVYIHETAVMIIEHAAPAELGGHGDCSLAQELVMSLPASMRRESLIMWFGKFTPIVVKNSDDFAAKMHPKGSKMYVEWDIQGAKDKPFYELAKENKEPEPLDAEGLLKLLSGLAARLKSKADKGEIDPIYKESALAAAAQIEKIKIRPAKPANDAEQAPVEQVA